MLVFTLIHKYISIRIFYTYIVIHNVIGESFES